MDIGVATWGGGGEKVYLRGGWDGNGWCARLW